MSRAAIPLGALLLFVLSGRAIAQTLVLDEPLRGGASGSVGGGSFGPDGWRVTGKDDHIYWHIPTVQKGVAEFSVRGLAPSLDEQELFHMYDWTYGSADTQYGGYRDGPYKQFLRKRALNDGARANAMKIVWRI